MIRERARESTGLDERSFDDAFTALYALAYRVAFRVLGQREEATDIAQETLARAALRWNRVQDHSAPWVATVAGNLAIGYWRKTNRRDAIEQRSPAARGGGSVDDRPIERMDLVRALRALPKRQRQVVVLRYLADCSEAEVAALIGCSQGTVKSSASRGLTALRAAAEEGR